MAILCLLLGLLSAVGSGSSQDPTTVAVTTIPPTSDPNPPSSVAAAAPTEAPRVTAAATSAAATLPNTAPSITTTAAATIAGQPATVAAPSSGTHSAAPSSVASVTVRGSPESPSAVAKQTTASAIVTPASQSNAGTAGDSVTSPPAVSKQPEGTKATEPPQEIPATKAGENVTASPTTAEIPPQNLETEPPIGTHISTPALMPSASPPPKTTSSTAAGGIIPAVITTKPATPDLPSHTSSVPAVASEITTRGDVPSPTTPEAEKVKKPSENIEVKCTNIENPASLVKIKVQGSAICDNGGQQTEDGQAAKGVDAITMDVCKALKPGYQGNQDKCVIRLARINDNELAIAEAYIESRLQPKELYTQLKRNGAKSALFSFDGADPEDVDVVSIPLISAIVSLAALLLIIAAAYGCWHQRKARKREQRLTEELQTMENGYHDNPTLEVMETSPEMQEKKGGPNGELGDSWIVPLDNLTREDLEEEEDTHL